jgi:anti-anti-sigma factor
MRQPLRVQSERTPGGVSIHRLAGDLFGGDAGYAFQEKVCGEIDGGQAAIVLDLGGVTRLDSAGIGILAAIATAVRQASCRLVLASLSPKVEATLGIVMFLDVVERAPSVAEALARLEPSATGSDT